MMDNVTMSSKSAPWDKHDFYLAILATPEDAVFLLKTDSFCKPCANAKLQVIRYCEISRQDTKELHLQCRVRICRVQCECNIGKKYNPGR